MRNTIGLQLTVEGLLFTLDKGVEERMKGCRVVVVKCVAELMQDDELAQMVGEEHHKER